MQANATLKPILKKQYLEWYSCFTLEGLEYSCLIIGGSKHCKGGGGVNRETLAIFEAIERSSAASSTSISRFWPRPQLKSVGVSGNSILGECLGDNLANRSESRSLEAPPKSLADLGVAGVKKSKTELKRKEIYITKMQARIFKTKRKNRWNLIQMIIFLQLWVLFLSLDQFK